MRQQSLSVAAPHDCTRNAWLLIDVVVLLQPGVYSFINLDTVCDFLVEIEQPILELDFMPDWLASNNVDAKGSPREQHVRLRTRRPGYLLASQATA